MGEVSGYQIIDFVHVNKKKFERMFYTEMELSGNIDTNVESEIDVDFMILPLNAQIK